MSSRTKRGAGALAWAALAMMLLLWRAPGFDYFATTREYDHGYQTALGQQVFHGAVPGVDYFTQYGPAIGWLSALSWATGHVWLAEVICWCLFVAAGYGLLWWWLPRDARIVRKVCVLLPAFCFTPYYAKYYFVFFPALFLVLLGDGPAQVSGQSNSWRWFFAGVIAGIAGLFRIELGLALAASGGVFLGWDDVVARRFPRAAMVLLAGALVVTVGYFFLLIVSARDLAAPIIFLDFQLTAILAKTAAFSARAVSLGWPTEPADAGGWMLVLMSVLYLGVGLAWIQPGWRQQVPARAWAAVLMGGALLPQALHRMDPTHVRQVALPACACVAACCLQRWEFAALRTRLFVALFAVTSLGLGFWTLENYSGWWEPIPRKLASLNAEIPIEKASPEWTHLAAAIQKSTGPDDAILVASLDARIYALTRHPWAGLFPHLVLPMPPRWQQRCIEELRRHPPAMVIIPTTEDELRPALSYHGKNPLIEAFIHEKFEPGDASVAGWLLLRPRSNPEKSAR